MLENVENPILSLRARRSRAWQSQKLRLLQDFVLRNDIRALYLILRKEILVVKFFSSIIFSPIKKVLAFRKFTQLPKDIF